MKRIPLVLAVLGLVFSLVAISLSACSHPPTSGTVTSRHYYAGYWSTYTTHTCIQRSKYGTCLISIPNSYTNYIQPEYTLCLRASPGAKTEKTGCFDVSESTYNQYPKGSYYAG